MISVTGAVMEARVELSLKTCDQDKDQMLDFWEQRNGLDWTDGTDAYDDPDSDGMYNLHEYWANTSSSVSNSNYAISDAMFAVDKKIAGLNPTNSLRIFNENCYATTNFIRNTNCWAYSYDLTCISPWNSYSKHLRAGTLITPRHVLFAAHFDQIPTNRVLWFIDQQSNVVARTLVAKKQHPLYEKIPIYPGATNVIQHYPDLTVGLLDSDVPTNCIGFAKVLPDDFRNYLGTGERLPVLRLDQEEKALIGDATVLSTEQPQYNANFTIPSDLVRQQYYESLTTNDSGNPAFLILNQQLVLLTVWTGMGPGYGTSVTAFKGDINQLIFDLDAQCGVTNGYQLTEIDLSGFEPL